MSRSGYSDDIDNWALIKWRGQVTSAIRGARGQKFLQDMVAALDALPEKRLVADELQAEGSYCALGAVLAFRGLDAAALDPEDPEQAASALDIAHQLAKEVTFENDEALETYDWVDVEICGPMRAHRPYWERHVRRVSIARVDVEERRWWRMRAWATGNIVLAKGAS